MDKWETSREDLQVPDDEPPIFCGELVMVTLGKHLEVLCEAVVQKFEGDLFVRSCDISCKPQNLL